MGTPEDAIARVLSGLGERDRNHFRVLVFPCGSEVGSEVIQSLAHARRVQLVGVSSVSDHGEFLCSALGIPYLDGLPFLTASDFLERFAALCVRLEIDFVFPCMDLVAAVLSENEGALGGAAVIASPAATTRLCANKRATYARLAPTGLCPRVYEENEITDSDFPVVMKPAVGYGARGVRLLEDRAALEAALDESQAAEQVLCEALPGPEYTVDCFSDAAGTLIYCNSRVRARVRMGISVRTLDSSVSLQDTHRDIAHTLNGALELRGAWFFQLKEDRQGRPRLLEVAARIGGSSGLARAQGVNLALLSLYDRAGFPVSATPPPVRVALDRALNQRLGVLEAAYLPTHLYVDFDDCLRFPDGSLNPELVALVVEARNRGMPVTLLSRHAGDLDAALQATGVARLFDRVDHLTDRAVSKASRMAPDGLLVDDSFLEVRAALEAGRIAVGIDNLELARALIRTAVADTA